MWRPERVVFVGGCDGVAGRGCYGWWVRFVPAFGLVEDVG
jgi:hypothetical protein